MSNGKKYDGGKSPVFQGCLLYFPRALEAVAFVSEFGKEKYEAEYRDQNWREVDDADRYQNAKSRHLLAQAKGEVYAGDSRYLHAAHEAWNALAVLERLLTEGVPLKSPEVSMPPPGPEPMGFGQMWKAGDLVQCTESQDGSDLVKGAEYTVVRIIKCAMGTYLLKLTDDRGEPVDGEWAQERFTDVVPF